MRGNPWQRMTPSAAVAGTCRAVKIVSRYGDSHLLGVSRSGGSEANGGRTRGVGECGWRLATAETAYKPNN